MKQEVETSKNNSDIHEHKHENIQKARDKGKTGLREVAFTDLKLTLPYHFLTSFSIFIILPFLQPFLNLHTSSQSLATGLRRHVLSQPFMPILACAPALPQIAQKIKIKINYFIFLFILKI